MGKRKAGCVPVRRGEDGEWEVLMVHSLWTPEIWLFPKGNVESDETGKEAALRKAREKAGVDGLLGPKLGSWQSTHASQKKQKMWLLFVATEYGATDERWEQRGKREREWMSFAAARDRLGDGVEKQALRRPELTEMLDCVAELLRGVSGDGSDWRAELGRGLGQEVVPAFVGRDAMALPLARVDDVVA